MKRKTVILIVAFVAGAHALVFYCIASRPVLPRVPSIPPPNFSLGWAKFTDPKTREKMVYQEFTVTTRMDASPTPATP